MSTEPEPTKVQDPLVRGTFEALLSGKARKVTKTNPLTVDDVPDYVVLERDIDTSSLGSDEIELLRKKEVPLDRQLATWYLDLAPVPGERLIRRPHVTYLVDKMTNGQYRPELTSLGVCLCEEDDTIYGVNGRHTSKARLAIEDTNWAPPITVNFYKTSTLAGVRALYAQFDRGAPRTRNNIVESYLATTPPFDSYGKDLRSKLAGGVALYKWSAHRSRQLLDAEQLVAVMTDELVKQVSHAAEILSAVQRKERSHVSRAGTIAAMFATYNVSPLKSTEFWSVVRDGVGVASKTDPRLKLRDTLKENAVGSANTSRKRQETIPSGLVYTYSINAWNMWREGKPMSRMIGSRTDKRPVAK